MNNLNLQNLETKITYLERHVEEQDKEILRLNRELAVVVKELTVLKEQINTGSDSKNDPTIDERPPHY